MFLNEESSIQSSNIARGENFRKKCADNYLQDNFATYKKSAYAPFSSEDDSYDRKLEHPSPTNIHSVSTLPTKTKPEGPMCSNSTP